LIKRTPPPTRAARIGAAEPEGTPRAKQCLIVDDSRVIRKVARRIVESLNFVVDEAENGEEALAKCKASMPDLILLDWNMPVMSGLEFITTLNRMPSDRQPKVVFCTTNSDALDIHKGIEAGAVEYLLKPFDQQTLFAKLQRIGAA
jgi:two-component system chemotaxis response regulator CheY